jgi:hypothetical protein
MALNGSVGGGSARPWTTARATAGRYFAVFWSWALGILTVSWRTTLLAILATPAAFAATPELTTEWALRNAGCFAASFNGIAY